MVQARQVLNEAEFQRVQADTTLTRDGLLRWLGTPGERKFWQKTLEDGEINDDTLGTAIDLLVRHGAIDETLARARHYGAIARDALALFPDSTPKSALLDVIDFVTSRAH